MQSWLRRLIDVEVMDSNVLSRTRNRNGWRPHWIGVIRKLELELDRRISTAPDIPGGDEVLFIGLLLTCLEPVRSHGELGVSIRRIRYLDRPLAIADGIGGGLEWGGARALSDQATIPDSGPVTAPPGANYWEDASHYLARLTITVPDGVPAGTGSSGPRTIIFGTSGILRLSTFSLSFRYPLSHGMISSRISAPGGFS